MADRSVGSDAAVALAVLDALAHDVAALTMLDIAPSLAVSSQVLGTGKSDRVPNAREAVEKSARAPLSGRLGGSSRIQRLHHTYIDVA